ncbi:hypothetical protein [Ruegeria arenilitoris]|uniref:hypothetical protein n=1 Tax=Ruegeria arenilitoris TaxID=1173585 RepID=UPI00147E751E|nr:hypothetical protein [Ruegeria arenilitoris]
MNKRTNLHDENLKARVKRLLSGEHHVEDIAKLYAGKRFNSYGRASFRELADFAAHPDIRNRGPVTDRVRDMRTTFKPLYDKALKNEGADFKDVVARIESNFRMASDEQISAITNGRKRQQIKRLVESAAEKLRRDDIGSISEDEQKIAVAFGDRLIWNPALRAQEVFEDFKYVMVKNGLVPSVEADALDGIRPLVVLYAISVMHGTAFDLGDGMTGELQAGFNNPESRLEVTTLLTLKGYPKKVSMKLGLFWTDLNARNHVEPALLEHPGPWPFAIEVRASRISPIGKVTPLEEPQDTTAHITIK